MRNKGHSRRFKGCVGGQILREALLEERLSLEKEAFLAHASSCRCCRRQLELIEDLRRELGPQLEQLPESPLRGRSTKFLHQAAREELARLPGRRPGRRPLAKAFSLPRLAAAGLVLTLAFGLTLVLSRSSHQDIFRETPRAGREGMSPQGTLREKPSQFEWSEVAGATCYSFELVDENLELLAQSQRSSKTNFTLPPEAVQKLGKGRVYVWTVKAYDDEGGELGERSAEFNIH